MRLKLVHIYKTITFIMKILLKFAIHFKRKQRMDQYMCAHVVPKTFFRHSVQICKNVFSYSSIAKECFIDVISAEGKNGYVVCV